MRNEVKHTFYVEYGEVEYEVIGCATLIHDSNYGADADGNRGVSMDFIDDISFELCEEAKKLPEADQNAIFDLAEKLGDKHDWADDIIEPDEPDYDDYEPDYDD